MKEQMLHDAVIGDIGHAVPNAALGLDRGIQNLIGLHHRLFLGRGLRSAVLRSGRTAAGGHGQEQAHG